MALEHFSAANNYQELQAMMYESIMSLRYSLDFGEIFWRTHYLWLKEQGYQLRPRYAPDWVASWKGTNKHYSTFPDGLSLLTGPVCDAIHIPTGTHVGLKKLREKDHPLEESIHRFLTTDSMLADPRNHSVPLLEVLYPPDVDPEHRLLVMPLLRPFESPNFDTIGEAVECIRQLFEGLQFLHEHHVAHRDLNMTNFMMEAKDMFPEGYHPQSWDSMLKPDLSGSARYFTRTERPPKYYIIDFGISRRYDANNTSPREPIVLGGDDTVPEFKNTYEPQNPYWTDVYYAGNLVRECFTEGHLVLTHIRGYRGFEFLKPLIADMVQDDPSKRPTMDEVVKRFEVIVSGLSAWKLRSRTPWRRANVFQGSAHFVSHWSRKMVYCLKRTPAIPRPAVAS